MILHSIIATKVGHFHHILSVIEYGDLIPQFLRLPVSTRYFRDSYEYGWRIAKPRRRFATSGSRCIHEGLYCLRTIDDLQTLHLNLILCDMQPAANTRNSIIE